MDYSHVWLAVIAGGQGTRLFPISHPGRPKQFCHLNDEGTFIQVAIKNFLSLGVKPSHVVIITTDDNQTELAKKQTLPMGVFSQDIYQIEPDWGYPGAMYKAEQFIRKIDPEAIIINTPADQYLESDDDDFEYTIKIAVEEAVNDYPVLIGVKVNDLNTAMGCGHAIFEDSGRGCYQVTEFIEKPNSEAADAIMRRDDSACNTGITVWKAGTTTNVYSEEQVRGLDTDDFLKGLDNLKIAVGTFTWRDCGTFKSLFEVSKKTQHHKNASLGQGEFERVRCRRCLLYAPKDVELIVSDAEDVAVIFTFINERPVLLVSNLDDSQLIKKLAEDYAKNEEIFKKDFSLCGARNNQVLGSNISEELVAAFVGVRGYAVFARKHSDGTFAVVVSKQFQTR